MGLEKGIPILPAWYGVIRMAQNWQVPAWEISPDYPAVFWYIRAQFVWNLEAKLKEKQYRQSQSWK